MSQNIGGLSLEDNQPLDFRGRTHPGQLLYGDNTVLSISAPDDLLWSPAPPGPSSPISLTTSRPPADGRAGNDNGKLGRRRSARSVQASMNRRKSPGPGKFVCHICRDDFTTKHRLKGHIDSKHEGKTLTCSSCNMVLSHGTSYDRHLKRTCPVLYPRNLT
ncbi:hypothetical protein EV421DRAFT_257782 [Armillaria borealis]|uniref:C2H2-type domain-containing protein n=1 Tax=Armillaria borealis TaxID=47425 RepID=A0AA39JRM1_9AGAR|nr:hypothetical protein EV421DRAFT_257782 [Armillaria borealis]